MRSKAGRRTAAILEEAPIEGVLVADIAPRAGEDVGVDLRLRRAVDVDAPREDALRTRAAIGTAAYGTCVGVDRAVRARRAGRRLGGVAANVAADGVELARQQQQQQLARQRRCGRGLRRPGSHVEGAQLDRLGLPRERMARCGAREAGEDEQRRGRRHAGEVGGHHGWLGTKGGRNPDVSHADLESLFFFSLVWMGEGVGWP